MASVLLLLSALVVTVPWPQEACPLRRLLLRFAHFREALGVMGFGD